jgi:hypothetical protein
MRYVAHVVAVYPADQAGNTTFDVWENIVVVKGERPSAALERAIQLTQAALDNEENWRALGYLSGPILYGVRTMNSYVQLPSAVKGAGAADAQILVKSISITKTELEELQSFGEISTGYRLMHLSQSKPQ